MFQRAIELYAFNDSNVLPSIPRAGSTHQVLYMKPGYEVIDKYLPVPRYSKVKDASQINKLHVIPTPVI